MPESFGTREWAAAAADRLRSDADVAAAGQTWYHGPLLLFVEPDDKSGVTDTTALRIDVHHGRVQDCRLADVREAQLTPFVVSGSFPRWKQAFLGNLDLLDAILESKLRVKGDLPALQRHQQLLRSLLSAIGGVDTAWPDEVEDAAPAGAR